MKNRFIVIYTVFAAAVFIFSIGFFGYNLYREYSTNLEKSDAKFNELTANITTLSFSYEENTDVYSKAIKNAISDPLNYSFIQIRRNNETVVLYPTGKSKSETVSKLTKSFESSVIVNKKPLSIDCNYYLIRPDSIFYYARISFLMILIITIITIIMIIYLNLTESSSDVISIEEDADENFSEDENILDEDISKTEENVEAAETEKTEASDSDASDQETANESSGNHGEIENYYSEDAFENDEVTEAETEAETETSSSEVTPEEVKAIFAEPLTDEQAQTAEYAEPARLPVDEIKPSETNEPSGLYNPETGISWESYLFTRLNNEIDRATASEIDLSLFIIKLSGVEKTSEMFKNVCNYLAIQFQFKDLLFEYKEDCIVAIKISMNVDEALTLAEKLYNDISNIVNNKASRIGISSRSIRMVGGDRLILEAEQAIEHSDQTSPIIAFRVDSEKYRKLMEQNQA